MVQLIIVGLSVGAVTGDDIDLNQLKQHLPADIQIPPGLDNATAVIATAKKMFKEKCDKVHADENVVKEVENGIFEMQECLTNIINITAIQKEIEIAKPQGELDTVFHKYCDKRPDVMKCIDTFNEKLMKCLDDEETKSYKDAMNMTNKLLDFVCYKGGDQIALFFAEKGPECLQERADDIQNCLNATFSPYIPKEGFSPDGEIPKLVIGPKQHEDFEKLKVCIVESLEKCEEITPANIVESMFKFIQVQGNEKPTASAPALQFSILLLGLLSFVSHRIFFW